VWNGTVSTQNNTYLGANYHDQKARRVGSHDIGEKAKTLGEQGALVVKHRDDGSTNEHQLLLTIRE